MKGHPVVTMYCRMRFCMAIKFLSLSLSLSLSVSLTLSVCLSLFLAHAHIKAFTTWKDKFSFHPVNNPPLCMLLLDVQRIFSCSFLMYLFVSLWNCAFFCCCFFFIFYMLYCLLEVHIFNLIILKLAQIVCITVKIEENLPNIMGKGPF